jgi:hypothetical protein
MKKDCSINYSLNEISLTQNRTVMTTVSKRFPKIGSDRAEGFLSKLSSIMTKHMFYDDEK